MSSDRPGRRRFLHTLGLVLSAATLPGRARAHTYPEDGFVIIHPWCREAVQGTAELAVSLVITEVTLPDRLLAAVTPVADEVVLRAPGSGGANALESVELTPGRDLFMTPFSPHFVLRGIKTDLLFGREYPLTFTFDRAGEVQAALIIGQH